MDLFQFLNLLGGLSLFLFGMSVMGQALERRAGSSLRRLLGRMTTNKAAGLLTGLAVTAVIQSSSATTVMVVGFVNSSLMTLGQAINMIMGANIGTTVTAWLLSLTGISSGNLFVRLVLALAALGNLGILLVLKYSGFFVQNVNTVFGLRLSVPAFVMPIGISFYTLQAVSYLFDVYQGTVKADRNLMRVALFLSFFPQIVEGPICRYGQTADQLWNAGQIRYDNLTLGLQRILFGLMKKLVVADRLNTFVEGVFDKYWEFQGGVIAIAAVCYTIQLYMDFSGSMDAVTGTAQIFGITMPENFKRPFFSRTISEFWTRWHITLGTWFKDYIFYPVSMSKPMKKLTGAARKKLGNHFGPLAAGGIALFCVWFCNGVWHGAAWSFIFFGMYHFVLILGGSLIAPAVKKVNEKLHLSPESRFYCLFQVLRTCVLVVIGELFFRANGLRAGMYMFGRMVTDFRFSSLNAALLKKLSIDGADFLIVGVTVLIVFVVSLLNEKGICVRESLQKKPTPVRWAVLYALILYIIIFGAYGVGYVPVDPMYANF